MSQEMQALEAWLPRLRRYGALLLGSKKAADDRLETVLGDMAALDLYRAGRDPILLFRAFHAPAVPLPPALLSPDDFSGRDQRYVRALHKLQRQDRAMLLLTGLEGFEPARTADIIDMAATDVAARVARAHSLFDAAVRNRLCIIVEDDLIALRDLQAQVIHGGLCVAGTAKNCIEAYGLAEEMKPDIGIVDLALPEGAIAGAEVAKRLRERFATRIIYVTAFAKLAREIADPRDSVVAKPWSPASLKQAIAAAGH